jgi:coenzyme F420 hydrogenase subunit beta
MERKSYLRLKEEVWDRGICSGCGACVAVCPADAICFGEAGGAPCPHNIGYCKEESDEVPCGACYEACPRTSKMQAEEMGPFQEILSAKAAFAVPRAQSGGAVTALLVNALEEGLIDAVVTVSEDRWTLRPSSVVISSSDALIHQAGSRYSWWVPLVAALKTAVVEKKFRRIAIIGVPCVVQAVDRIRKSDHELLRPYGKSIRLLIGLFCTESFDYNALVEGKLKKEYKIDTWKVDRLDVKGKLEVRMRDGTSISIPVQELEAAVRPGCHYCLDLTAVYSDLSAGAAGSPAGFTSLIVRTDIGRMFLENAIRNQRIVTGPGPDVTAIAKLITRKLQKNQPESP